MTMAITVWRMGCAIHKVQQIILIFSFIVRIPGPTQRRGRQEPTSRRRRQTGQSGLLKDVKPFCSWVQCTQVIESNVTFGPYGNRANLKGKSTNCARTKLLLHTKTPRVLSVGDRVDVG